MFRHHRFPFSSSLLFLLAVVLAPPAFAQSTGPNESLEEIVVTGTRRADRVVTDSLSPIDLLSAEDLESQGFVEMDDLLRTAVPSYQVGRHPIDDGGTLVRPAKLRGLSSDQTLVLVNGKRRHRSAVITFISDALTTGSQGPDLSVIPTAALDRVEVLRDGASAQYGSDAIAGVINFILKEADSGGSFDARFGEYFEGDGATTHLTGNIGLPLGTRGFVNLTAEYIDQDETRRNILRDDVAALIEKREAIGASTAGLHEDTQIWGSPFVEAFNLFVNSGYELSANTRLYAFGNYAQREVDGGFFFRNPDTRNGVFAQDGERLIGITDTDMYRAFVPEMTRVDACARYRGPAVVREADETDEAFALRAQTEQDLLSDLAEDPNCFSLNAMFPNGFTPRFGGDVTDYSLTLGADGELAGGLRYDFSIYHGSNVVEFAIRNTVSAALGDGQPAGLAFRPGDYGQEETHVQLNFAQLFENGPLGGTPLHIGFGAEYREETFEIVAGDAAARSAATQNVEDCQALLDGDTANIPAGKTECTVPELLLLQGFTPASNGFSGFGLNQQGEWSRNNFSLYLDFENEFSESFALEAALRFEDYEDFGSTFEGKLAGRYNINADWLLRGTASTGFRAPTPGQSNVRNITTTFDFSGAGTLIESGLIPPTDPVAADFGAQPLEPEESTNLTLGLGWNSPSGLAVTLDAFWIEVQDRLAASDTIEITIADDENDPCLTMGNCLTRARFLEIRAENSGLREGSRISYYTNSWDTVTKGLELVASWEHDAGHLGTTFYTLTASHVDTEVTERDATTISDRRDYNIENLLPKTRIVLTANHHLAAWRFTGRASFWGSWSAVDSNAFRYANCPRNNCANSADGAFSYGEELTFDLEVAYNFDPGVTALIGAQNIFNQYPDRSPHGPGNGQSYHESAPFGPNGGFWYARLQYDF